MMVRVDLNSNITWSDGSKFTAEDVYYSFDVATDYALSNHAGALVWTSDLRHKSENGVLKTQGMYTYLHPDESETFLIPEGKEDSVIYLRVNKVLGALTTLFSTILILPEHIYKPVVNENRQLNSTNPDSVMQKIYQNPVGTGPWTLDRENTNTQLITLKRRKDYFLTKKDGSPLYTVDTIRLMLYLDSNTAIYSLKKGYIDMLEGSIPSNYSKLFEDDPSIHLFKSTGTSILTLTLNVNPEKSPTPLRELFKDISFRKAISLAIDQKELIDKVLNGLGREASPGLILESQTSIYNPEVKLDSRPLNERLEEANSILDSKFPSKDKSGYRLYQGKRISYEILTNAGQIDLVSYLQRQLQRIGVEVSLKIGGTTPESTYLYPGNFDMTLQGTIFSYSTVDIMYPSHFKNLERSSNYGRYQNEKLNSLIEEMRNTLDSSQKKELIKEIQKVIADSYYKIPLYSSSVLSVAREDRFTGFMVTSGCTVFNTDTLENLIQVKNES